MGSPTVFNFFTPSYAEDNYVKPNDMVSPEFEILHAVTAINYINLVENSIKGVPFHNRTRINQNGTNVVNNNQDRPFLDFTDEITVLESDGISALLDHLNIIICHGQLSNSTKTIIESTLTQLDNTGTFDSDELVREALYFIMVSPDYMILE